MKMPAIGTQALYEMFAREELKGLAKEALGEENSLTDLTKTVAKAWKAVKDSGKAATGAGGDPGTVPGESQVAQALLVADLRVSCARRHEFKLFSRLLSLVWSVSISLVEPHAKRCERILPPRRT